MRYTFIAKSLIALLACVASTAVALPRFALSEGQACVQCHANPAGGGMRTSYGSDVFGASVLAIRSGKAANGQVTDSLRLGGDARFQGYAYSDDDGVSSETRAGFFTMQADIGFDWRLSDDVSLFLTHDALRGAAEIGAVKTYRDGTIRVQVGSFMPNYGLRHDDHTAFVRGGSTRPPLNAPGDGLLWKPKFVDTGIEASAKMGPWVTVGVYNGDDTLPFGPDTGVGNDKAYLARAESGGKVAGVRTLAGANVYGNRNDDADSDMLLVGGFAGVALGDLTLMAEADYASDLLASESDPGSGATTLALYSEAAYRVTRGLYGIVRFEHFDPDLDAAAGRVHRASVGVELFPVPHVEFKPTLRFETDSRAAGFDSIEALLQSHWWF
ncbi:hypothetical protein FJZ36_08950 [Candidatus Poribacteria bacterium]|nr:hypothetical protein [Candidatus Poribacteria bacterium]